MKDIDTNYTNDIDDLKKIVQEYLNIKMKVTTCRTAVNDESLKIYVTGIPEFRILRNGGFMINLRKNPKPTPYSSKEEAEKIGFVKLQDLRIFYEDKKQELKNVENKIIEKFGHMHYTYSIPYLVIHRDLNIEGLSKQKVTFWGAEFFNKIKPHSIKCFTLNTGSRSYARRYRDTLIYYLINNRNVSRKKIIELIHSSDAGISRSLRRDEPIANLVDKFNNLSKDELLDLLVNCSWSKHCDNLRELRVAARDSINFK